ncbi:hypothetical protein [Winogradskyella poriferorum]|uniref:hypothetical protein n=1 Tax=Winogradskyella poriferorum TaxID=307627 RepID=UPI003D649911
MKKILKLFLIGCLVLSYGCRDEFDTQTPNYIAFGTNAITETVDVGEGSKTIEVNVYTGNKVGTDRTFNLTTENSTAAAAAYSAPSSVVIEAGTNSATVSITVNEAGLTFDFQEIVLEFSPTTDIDTLADTASVTINAALLCPLATASNVTIEIDTDNWPDETSWAVTDSSGAVVASGGPYNNPADDFTTIVVNVTLGAGTYTMTLNDSYGDGGSTFRVLNGCGQLLATDSVTASTVSGNFSI